MKKLIIVLSGLAIFLINVAFGNECIQPHTTHNVGHQFYEALVETPKDAIVEGAVATKELSQNVGAALVASNAARNLKDAAKKLVIDAPVKTAYAIKNGTIKVLDKTKSGASIAYDSVIRKPAHKIKDAAQQVANSDFVQGTKETFVELGEQFAEFGHDVADATKNGAHTVYHVMFEKPAGAVKAAAHYLTHKKTGEKKAQDIPTCVMILPAPLLTARSLQAFAHNQNSHGVTVPNVTTITVLPLSWVDGSVQVVTDSSVAPDQEDIGVEFLMDVPCQFDEGYCLSENTIKKLADVYQSIQNDLLSQQ